MDTTGVLADIQLEDSKPAWQKAKDSRKSKKEKLKERQEKLETAYSALSDGSTPVTQKELAEYLDTTERTVLNYVKEHEDFIAQKGIIYQVANVEKMKK